MKNYPLARPQITKKDKQAVMSVLDSGQLALGPNQANFEKKFAQKIGTKFACAVSSGTAGLHLAMLAAGIKDGDEVITSPFSFIASSNCILYVGAKPVFVDVDPITYNIDPFKIEAKITSRTKAILVVHIFGQSADMDPIMRLAKKYNLKIIEDACESISATYKGRPVGTFGESAVFAFYPNKQMTTGEGGMVVTKERRIYDVVCSLSNQGRDVNMQWLDHQYLGYNYRMDEMSAALGSSQLKRLDSLIKERVKIAKWYEKYLGDFPNLVACQKTRSENTHTWFLYVVSILVKRANRDEIMARLQKKGVSSKQYLPSIHLFSFYRKKFGYRRGDFPISESISDTTLALPFYVGLTEKDVKDICKILIRILQYYDKRIQR